MGYTAGTFSARPNYQLQLNTALAGQNINGNYSTVNWSLYIVQVSGSDSYRFDNSNTWSVNIAGQGFSGSFSYDFRGYNSLLLGSGSVNIGHNPDGTQSYGFSASCNATSPLGSASCGSSEGLPTIPRASNATLSANSIDAGTPVTVYTNRASSSFTHDIIYTFGTASGAVATNITDSAVWTPPLSLMNQIPNSTSGVGNIITTTYSTGGTYIGQTSRPFTLTVPASIVPDFTTLTCSEATAGLAAIVGAYVQGLSTLNLAITGAVGAYGSTVTAYSTISVAGQTFQGQTAPTTQPITLSGTVTITGIVRDSRGRQKTKTIDITVLPYAPPAIDSGIFKLQRSDAAGVIDESGTYIRVDLHVSASSLLVSSTEKNSLTYKIYTRLRGDVTWILKTTITPAGVTFNSFDKVGTYSLENAWEVRVDVVDKFNTATIQGTVATGTIFMHWGEGLGIGKFWERGAVDVLGPIYQNDGEPVQPSGIVVMTASATAPVGWLICQGQSLLRTTYPNLFAILSTTYGAADSTHFNLPNLQGLVVVGRDPAQTEFNTLGETGGAKTHTLSVTEIPSHAHAQRVTNPVAGGTGIRSDYDSDGASGIYPQGINTDVTGGGAAHNNLQPYMALNYIIKI